AGLRRGCDDESLAGAGAHGSESAAAATVVVRDDHVGRVWVVDFDCVDGARLAVHFDGAGAAGDEWNGEPYAGPAQKSDAHRILRFVESVFRPRALHEPDLPRLVREREGASGLVVDGSAGHDLDQYGHLGPHARDALEHGQDVRVVEVRGDGILGRRVVLEDHGVHAGARLLERELERALNGPLDVQGRNGDLAGEAGCERLEVGQGARRGSHGELTATVCRKHTLRGGGERRQLFETAVQVHRVLALFLFHYAAGASVVPQPPAASAP